jgi:hypothetical protein
LITISFLKKYRYGFRRFGIHTFFIVVLLIVTSAKAQHTIHEIGFSFAYAGQAPFISSNNDQSGFFRQPLIWNIRYQVATNYVQSLAIVLERVSELRNRTGLWPNDFANSSVGAYNANIAERLYMTTFGLEGTRTFIRSDIFRLGIGISLGYGFGGASANVKNNADGSQKIFDSSDLWSGFLVSTFLRGRFTIYTTNALDIGFTGSIRLWGFPSIGPLTLSETMYDGPILRSIFEIGYIAGVSIGLK